MLTPTDYVVEFIVITIVLAFVLAIVPAPRALRAYLVRRAIPGTKATKFARWLSDGRSLSVLTAIGALDEIARLKQQDLEDELLGNASEKG